MLLDECTNYVVCELLYKHTLIGISNLYVMGEDTPHMDEMCEGVIWVRNLHMMNEYTICINKMYAGVR